MPIGSGLGPTVHSLAVLPGERVVAGGSFLVPSAGLARIAIWNGLEWTPMGTGVNANFPSAIAFTVSDFPSASSIP